MLREEPQGRAGLCLRRVADPGRHALRQRGWAGAPQDASPGAFSMPILRVLIRILLANLKVLRVQTRGWIRAGAPWGGCRMAGGERRAGATRHAAPKCFLGHTRPGIFLLSYAGLAIILIWAETRGQLRGGYKGRMRRWAGPKIGTWHEPAAAHGRAGRCRVTPRRSRTKELKI